MRNVWEGRARGKFDFTAGEDAVIHAAFDQLCNTLMNLGQVGSENALRLISAADALHRSSEGYESFTLSRALALHEFGLGMKTKEEIGLSNDIYKATDNLRPLLSSAFRAGQEAAKLNWLAEQGFVARLFNRTGPLLKAEMRLALQAAENARQSFIDRTEASQT